MPPSRKVRGGLLRGRGGGGERVARLVVPPLSSAPPSGSEALPDPRPAPAAESEPPGGIQSLLPSSEAVRSLAWASSAHAS